MKTIFTLIALILLVTYSAFAQLDKGYWIGDLSGEFGTNGRSSSNKITSFSLNPQAMKLISKNTALGISLDFQFFKAKYYNMGSVAPSETTVSRYSSFELGPVVRKYFGNKLVKPFVELGTGIKIGRYYGINNPYSADHTTFDHYLKPSVGLSWWMHDKISLNLSAEYNILNFSNSYFEGFKLGVSFKLGNQTIKK